MGLWPQSSFHRRRQLPSPKRRSLRFRLLQIQPPSRYYRRPSSSWQTESGWKLGGFCSRPAICPLALAVSSAPSRLTGSTSMRPLPPTRNAELICAFPPTGMRFPSASESPRSRLDDRPRLYLSRRDVVSPRRGAVVSLSDLIN